MSYNSFDYKGEPVPVSNLTRAQWDQIVNALTFFIRTQGDELEKHNVGDKEWQELRDYEGTLNDILFYVLSINTEER